MVTDFYAPYVGGVEQHVRSLAHGLADDGVDVAVAAVATPRTPVGVEWDGPVLVHRVPTLAARVPGLHGDADRPWALPVPDPLASWHLRRIILDWRPDVVHGHDWLGRSAAPWCSGRVRLRHALGGEPARRGSAPPPFVVSQHYFTRSCATKNLWREGAICPGPALSRCVSCASRTYGPAGSVPVVLGTRLGAAIEDRAGATIAVSRATADGNETPGEVHVIPNMLATPRASMASSAAAPTELGVAGAPYALFVGDLRETKGFGVLLEAHRSLDASERIPLVVVGETDASSPDRLPADVHHVGAVPNAEVHRLMARARYVVVPSQWAEPFGIVAIEAMQAGRPAIVTDTGGLGELVDDGRTGLVVGADGTRADRVQGLAAAMRRLSTDADLADRLGDAAASAALRFRPEAVVPRIEQVYDTLVAGPAESGVSGARRRPLLEESPPADRGGSHAGQSALSVVVTNRDYARFVGEAVDSAIAQGDDVEVVVVDDGSVDDSLDVLRTYGSRITVVPLDGRGQAAGMSAGFQHTTAPVVVFLDADDRLAPGLRDALLPRFADRQVARVHFPLRRIDGGGRPSGGTVPSRIEDLPHGDLQSRTLRAPHDVGWQPTSGNAYRREVLAEVLPQIPHPDYVTCADHALNGLSALHGRVERLVEVGGDYRIHDANADARTDLDLDRLRGIVARSEVTSRLIETHAARLGLGPERHDTVRSSVSWCANRLVSLRLEPGMHPVDGDGVRQAWRDGVDASMRRVDLGPVRRAGAAAFVSALAIAPRAGVSTLASRYLTGATDVSRRNR